METTTDAFFDSIRSQQCDDSWMPEQLHSIDAQEWVAEPKFDGFRLVAVVYETTVGFFTREGKRQDGKLDHIKTELMEKFPVGTVLDGEITAMKSAEGGKIDNRFEWVQSVMLSKPERAMSQQQDNNDWLTFMVYDAMQYGDVEMRDIPLFARRQHLEEVFVRNHPWRNVALSPQMPPTEVTYNHLTALGFEGIVVKRLSAEYKEKKSWYKVKAQHPIDAVILGFTRGEGKYTGQIGAMVFGQPYEDAPKEIKAKVEEGKAELVVVNDDYYVERGQCSGMNDTTRLLLSQGGDALIGSVVEIAHMGLMPGGVKFRHPQFKRFREDKPLDELRWHDR